MKYIFTLNLFSVINIDNLLCKFDQKILWLRIKPKRHSLRNGGNIKENNVDLTNATISVLTARSLQLSILFLSITMRLAPSMNVYIYVVTCLKSVDDIYMTIYRKQKEKEIWKVEELSNSACENFLDNNENFLARELFTVGMDLSLTTAPNMLWNLTFKNLPFPVLDMNGRTQKLQVNRACL